MSEKTDPSGITRFLVTGCGRSGTGFISTTLTSLGCPCGHEVIFRPESLHGAAELHWPPVLPGESSWLGAPYIESLPEHTRLFHQVREPVSVIRSFARIGFFETPSWYLSFAEQQCPPLARGTVLERCMRYWLEWNAMVEAFGSARPDLSLRRHRLEDIDSPLLREILEEVDCPVTDERIDRTLELAPTTYNTSGDKDADRLIRWDSLPEGDLKQEIRRQATEYGYGEPTEDGTLAI